MGRRPAVVIRHIRARTMSQHPLGLRNLPPADQVIEQRLAAGGGAIEIRAVRERAFRKIEAFSPNRMAERIGSKAVQTFERVYPKEELAIQA